MPKKQKAANAAFCCGDGGADDPALRDVTDSSCGGDVGPDDPALRDVTDSSCGGDGGPDDPALRDVTDSSGSDLVCIRGIELCQIKRIFFHKCHKSLSTGDVFKFHF